MLTRLHRLAWGLTELTRHGRPTVLGHFSAGLGDELLSTCVYHEMHARNPRHHIWVMSDRPQVYQRNRDISAVVPVQAKYIALARRVGAAELGFRYTKPRSDDPDRDQSPGTHVLRIMLAHAGVTGHVRLRPYLTIGDDECAAWITFRDVIVVQSASSAAHRPNLLKQYPAEQLHSAVDVLRKTGFRVVQVGAANDPAVGADVDLRGKTSLRDCGALLSNARLFVGLEGGLMHVARAVECPAVIIFGGRQTPQQTGYRSFTNLSKPVPCSPCWGWTRCDYQLDCIAGIAPDEIVSAAKAELSQPRAMRDEESEYISEAEAEKWALYARGLRDD